MSTFLSPHISVWGLVGATGLIVSFATFSGFFGQFNWLLELASHFRAQYLAFLLVLAIIFALGRRPRSAAIFLAVAGVNALVICPLYLPAERPSVPPSAALRVMLANVFTANRDSAKVRQVIHDYKPLLFVVEEVDEQWLDELRSLSSDYPYSVFESREDNFGIGLFSEIPLVEPKIIYVGKIQVPSIVAKIAINSVTITIVATHPLPPANPIYAQMRDDQLARLPPFLHGLEPPVVVLGDLNVTPWSYYFHRLLADAGLIDSMRGFGIQATWPTNFWPLLVPIDHCLYSSSVRALRRQVGPSIGSDHYPLIVDLEVGTT